MMTYMKFFVRGFRDCDSDECFVRLPNLRFSTKFGWYTTYVWQRHPAAINGANLYGLCYRIKNSIFLYKKC